MLHRLLVAVLLTTSPVVAAELRLVTGELPPYAFHVPPPTVATVSEGRVTLA